MRLLPRDSLATGAGEAGYALLMRAGVHLEERCDLRNTSRRTDGAFARLDFAFDGFLGEGAATGATAGAAVGQRQHAFHLVDAGVFPHVKLFVGDGQYDGENNAESAHERGGYHKFTQHAIEPRPALSALRAQLTALFRTTCCAKSNSADAWMC
jgi:hypothetical protein